MFKSKYIYLFFLILFVNSFYNFTKEYQYTGNMIIKFIKGEGYKIKNIKNIFIKKGLKLKESKTNQNNIYVVFRDKQKYKIEKVFKELELYILNRDDKSELNRKLLKRMTIIKSEIIEVTNLKKVTTTLISSISLFILLLSFVFIYQNRRKVKRCM